MRSGSRWPVVFGSLAIPFVASSCCTVLLWSEAAPHAHVERLLGAEVAADGKLALGAETNDGRQRAYRETQLAGIHLVMLPFERSDGTAASTWPLPADDAGEFLRLTVPYADFGDLQLPAIRLIRGESSFIEAIDESGKPHRWIELPDVDYVRWEHPGTWLCTVATPVAVAVDVVTFPFQAIFFLFLMPRC